MNVDFQSDLVTLEFKNGEQLEYFHGGIIRLQQESNLSGETLSPTRLLLQYINSFSKINKSKAFIVTKMIYLTTLLDNNGKSAIYTG